MVNNQYEKLQGKIFVNRLPDLAISLDSSKKGSGASCQGITTRSQWPSFEKTWHINIVELEAVRLAVLSFTKSRKLNSNHLQLDNMTALRLFVIY